MKVRLNALIIGCILFFSLNIYAAFQPDSEKSLDEGYFRESVSTENYLDVFGWPWWEEKKKEKDPNPFNLENIQKLEKKLQERIVGQDQAIKTTVSAIERYVYGLNDPRAPIASLLYVGPTGVGKTQLAKELAKILLGSEQELIRLNMAEYEQIGSATRLIGSPPGYVDHEKGGQLTEALKRNPYAIILIDEIEKAHPSVLKTFLQLFDEGLIADSKGKVVNCRNALFILTTNLVGQKILTMHDLGHKDQEILEAIQPTLINQLSPELYNRLEPVVFRGFKPNVMDDLVKILLVQAMEEVLEKKQINFEFDPSVIHFLREKATNYLLGARPFKQLIKQTIMTAITEALKENYLKKGDKALMLYQNSNFIIQNHKEKTPFMWLWKEEDKAMQPPFKFNDLLNLEEKLQQKVLGQPYAIKLTVAALMRYATGLGNSKSPIGSFLYVGPTGVGKTQLAKELARELMGSETHLIRLDMSEYVEPHSIARLIGPPPGYVNHEEGGQLTEALKQHPYAIVLLDEIEKAHPVVLKTFLQVFDEGRVSDSKGTVIDCRNVIFIATTNLAAAKILSMHEEGYPEEEILEDIQQEVIRFISPELYNRLEVAVFMGLGPELIEQLIHKMLREATEELYTKKKIQVSFDSSVIDFLTMNGYDYELGARPLKRLIQQTVVTSIAKEMIWGSVQSGDSIKLFYRRGEIKIEPVRK